MWRQALRSTFTSSDCLREVSSTATRAVGRASLAAQATDHTPAQWFGNRGQIAKIDILAAVAALGWTLLDPATNTFEERAGGFDILPAYRNGIRTRCAQWISMWQPACGPCQPGNKPYFVPNNLATRGTH